MSRIATVKETGIELSQDEWMRFEKAVADLRPGPWRFMRDASASLKAPLQRGIQPFSGGGALSRRPLSPAGSES